jgi:acyl-CoA synthetase (AMP-forming)/AMP-acid ligase II
MWAVGDTRMIGLRRSVADKMVDLAETDPERPFCIHYVQSVSEIVTYGSLFARASAIAQILAAQQCKPGDVVLIFVKHHTDLYASFIGSMLMGAIPSLMPYPNPKQDSALFWKSHNDLLHRIQPRLLVVSESFASEFAENLPSFAERIRTVESFAEPVGGATFSVAPGNIAFLQHSSGTTAAKKGVVLTHAEVLAQVAAYREAIGFTERDIIASWLPLYHDMGLISCFMMTLITGATLVALDPFDWVSAPACLLEVIERHRATFCWLPNFAFHHIANSTRRGRNFDLSSVRAFINCSEPCKAESFDVFRRRFAGSGLGPHSLQICYAMAENVFAVSQTNLAAVPRVFEVDRTRFEECGRAVAGIGLRLMSCGPPIRGVEVRIVTDDMAVNPDGVIGEVVIRSPFLFDGYFRQPEKTAAALQKGWYHTGDLGFMESGELFLTGRKDDLLITYGRNYYAHDVESIANQVKGVLPGRCVAFGIPDDVIGTSQVVLVTETSSKEDPTLAGRIREAVLAQSGLALSYVQLSEPGWLIKTTSGKISRSANRGRYLEGMPTRD